MINNEFYFDTSGWHGGDLYLKVEFPINIEKADELLNDSRDYRNEHPEIPFYIESSNVLDKKRFLKTSKAKHSISLSQSFLSSKNPVTEKDCIDWFTKGEKQTRFLRINMDNLFGNWSAKRSVTEEIRKTKNCKKLIEAIISKGLYVGNITLSGPKFVIPEKKFVKFSIDVPAKDLVEKSLHNNVKIKMISKFILSGSYQFRFLDYDV